MKHYYDRLQECKFQSSANEARSTMRLNSLTVLLGLLLNVTPLTAANPSGEAQAATESGPRGIVVNPYTDMVYAITASADTVTAINGVTNAVTAIKVGSGPKALAINPVTTRFMSLTPTAGPCR